MGSVPSPMPGFTVPGARFQLMIERLLASFLNKYHLKLSLSDHVKYKKS